MQSDLARLLEAAQSAAPDAEWLGLRRRTGYQQVFVAQDGAMELAAEGSDNGIMVEAFHAGQFGYAATPDTSPSGIAAAAKNALIAAKAASGLGVHRFSLDVRPPTRTEWHSPRVKKAAVPADIVYDFLFKACAALKVSDAVIQTQSMIESGSYEYELVSTNGAAIEQSIHYMGINLQAIARDGTIVQRRTANGPRGLTRQGGWELLDMPALLQKAHIVGKEAVELLCAQNCPSDRRT
ncbi:MAG TPA: TldD/PmbA family protein, partial [Spirochaetales bacterium]|nr:TldD/PmbA family protein [Spirochaetales bacterium]